MDKTHQENALDTVIELPQETRKEKDVRTLKDLELLLVGGGGDDNPYW